MPTPTTPHISKQKVRGSAIKIEQVLVGDKIMQLREPSIAATDEILGTLFDDSLISAVVEIAGMYDKRAREAEIERKTVERDAGNDPNILKAVNSQGLTEFFVSHAGKIAEILKTSVLPMVAKKAGLVAAIALDTAANRAAYEFAAEDRTGGRFSPALRQFVMEEVSPDQALEIVVAAKDMIDWGGLGKKLMALLPKRDAAVPTTETPAPNLTSMS